MPFGISVEFKGEYGLFTRPELKIERYTYPFMTPSAARGMIESVMWKPAIKYKIDRIHVLKPIRYVNLMRNEVSKKIPASNVKSVIGGSAKELYLSTPDEIVQRNSTVLYDVHYQVDFHFEMTDKAGPEDTEEKFYSMIRRRFQKGQCFSPPVLGTREFPARFSLHEGDDIRSPYEGETHDFGIMLYDMDYSNTRDIKPTFFHAIMKNGLIDLTDCEVMR